MILWLAGESCNIQWGKIFLPYLLSSQRGDCAPHYHAGCSLQDCSLRAGLAVLPGHADTSPKSRMSLEAWAVQQLHLPFKNPGRHIKKGAGSWHSTMGYWLLGTAILMGLQLLPIASPCQSSQRLLLCICCAASGVRAQPPAFPGECGAALGGVQPVPKVWAVPFCWQQPADCTYPAGGRGGTGECSGQ